MDKNKVYNVLNRSGSNVGYTIPDENIHRMFAPNETKKISYDELEKLTYVPGGSSIIQNCFLITDAEVLENLNMEPEPEYFITDKEVIDLLQTGSLDEFLDALDFAPSGVIEMIKDYAVKLPLNDVSKRKAIFEKTGFNVDAAVNNADAKESNIEKPSRRTSQESTVSKSARRTTPKYTIKTAIKE